MCTKGPYMYYNMYYNMHFASYTCTKRPYMYYNIYYNMCYSQLYVHEGSVHIS